MNPDHCLLAATQRAGPIEGEGDGATTLGRWGRGNDFRELAAELVKSVGVFKGYQVDLTEGGVGGTVSISTRKPPERDPSGDPRGPAHTRLMAGSAGPPRGPAVLLAVPGPAASGSGRGRNAQRKGWRWTTTWRQPVRRAAGTRAGPKRASG